LGPGLWTRSCRQRIRFCYNTTNPYYTIGAAFIDYALKIGGTQKVIVLLKYSNSDEGLYSAIKNKLAIDKAKINPFLQEYFLNYKK
jgi:ABC-type branched-subunit amino acid transport system substrate-binding protein